MRKHLDRVLQKAVGFLFGQCFGESPTTGDDGAHGGDQPHGYHGVSSSTVAVSALAQHLYHFEITKQVPEGLSAHVSSKKAQFKWYKKLSKAWRESKPPPTTPEEASRLVIHTLRGHKKTDIEGLLSFYGLPHPNTLVEPNVDEVPPVVDGLKFELYTLPVDAREVPDGDGLTVYVSVSDPRESSLVPHEVKTAALKRQEARGERNYTKSNALEKQMENAGYKVLYINNEEILARKYRIRLRGIDAPENAMPYGKEAKDELVKIVEGKCLKILIFYEDQYGRCVGDVYCNDNFVQKIMLEKGLAWHFIAYDKRPKLAKWEKDAKEKRIGLWALENPEMPWKWRKNHPQSRY